jgi:zinc protease
MIASRMPTFLALVLLVLLAPAASAQATLETYRLSNGLNVILAPDPSATTVAVNVWYDVGSRREPPGRSGFAHLFEHLMFQGSENVEPGGHSRMVTQAGGQNNAYIVEDHTAYFQTLPPDRYNLGLWLEAERMRSLIVTEEVMRREIEVVKEERRLRFDNAPYGVARLEAWYYLPYDASTCFAYAHSPIGSPADLDAATLHDVQRFFDTYYNPNNATVALAGAFAPAEARRLIQEYFGAIPRGPEPPPVTCEEPFRHLPVRRTIDDPNATLPAVMFSYGTPAVDHPDTEALNILISILSSGQSSRFNQRLVRDEQVALQASGFLMSRVGPGLVWVIGVANQDVEIEQVESSLDAVIDQVRRNGVTQAELDKARNNYLAGRVRERQTSQGTSEALQWSNHYLGDPRAMDARMERLRTLTVDDIRRVAATYLTPENRAVVVAVPVPGGA